jgi:hypothetical protein
VDAAVDEDLHAFFGPCQKNFAWAGQGGHIVSPNDQTLPFSLL